jgi:hypothetical protein
MSAALWLMGVWSERSDGVASDPERSDGVASDPERKVELDWSRTGVL